MSTIIDVAGTRDTRRVYVPGPCAIAGWLTGCHDNRATVRLRDPHTTSPGIEFCTPCALGLIENLLNQGEPVVAVPIDTGIIDRAGAHR